VTNPWYEKSRQLDVYRWQLLRERHGLLASTLRFIRDAVSDWWFGTLAKRRLAESVSAEPCDVLLLQSANKVIKFKRKKLLIHELRAKGHSLVETALQSPKSILFKRLLKCPPSDVPTRYFGLAAYAAWLVEHYQPRILVNDRNGSLYTPFLRLALNARGSKLVHLAHASTLESSQRLGMNDYDYYFLFGQSSLEALQGRPVRFGESTAVLSGSHMIDTSFDLPPADSGWRTLLILGVGPDKEKESGYLRTYALLRDWAVQNPDYKVMIKAHPRSNVAFWKQVEASVASVQVLPAPCTLAQALGQSSVVVNIMSNAVIEAALARRPVIYVNASDDIDIFSQERFFGPCVSTLDGLQKAVKSIEQNYEMALVSSASFAEYHLTHGCAGLSWNIQALTALLEGRSSLGASIKLSSTIES
jgi:hypothetical protein